MMMLEGNLYKHKVKQMQFFLSCHAALASTKNLPAYKLQMLQSEMTSHFQLILEGKLAADTREDCKNMLTFLTPNLTDFQSFLALPGVLNTK